MTDGISMSYAICFDNCALFVTPGFIRGVGPRSQSLQRQFLAEFDLQFGPRHSKSPLLYR